MQSSASRTRVFPCFGSGPGSSSTRPAPRATTALWLSCLLGGLPAVSTQAQLQPANTQTLSAFTAGQRFGESLAAGDLNGDGVNELVVLSDGVVTIFYRNASGEFEAGFEESLSADLAVAMCDLVPTLPGHELILGKPQNSVGAQAEAGVVQVFSVAGDPFGGGMTIGALAAFDQGDANVPGMARCLSKRAITLVRPWPPVTSTTTGSATWPWERRTKTAEPRWMWAACMCFWARSTQ